MLVQERSLDCVVSTLGGLPKDGHHAQAGETRSPRNERCALVQALSELH